MADSKEIKFTDDEMKIVSELQGKYVNVQNVLGQMGVSRIRLEQQFDGLEKAEEEARGKFAEVQNEERTFVQSINKKYGDGNLDLSSGVFTPNPVEETEKTL